MRTDCEVISLKIDIPIWEKATLTLEEAAAYYNVGINKLREVTDSPDCESLVLWVGNRRLIKRKAFEAYLLRQNSI